MRRDPTGADPSPREEAGRGRGAVHFLTSELESDSAGSFRQERWCSVYLAAGAPVCVHNVGGVFHLKRARFDDLDAFVRFRRDSIRPRASVREGRTAKLLRRLKHLLLADLFLPNVFLLYRELCREIDASAGPVLVVCSSPPFPLAFVGALLKRRRPKKVVLHVDMRDAWALHGSLGGLPFVKVLIERWTLRRADVVSTVSRGLQEELQRTYGIEVRVLYNVATHYFSLGSAAPAAPFRWSELDPGIREDSLKIVYTGSTPEGFYDLDAMMRGIAELRSQRADLADRIQVIFVGACEEARLCAERNSASGASVRFIAHVPHEMSMRIQRAADALLFLGYHGSNNNGVVSTKIFEYLALGEPVLPLFVRPGSDVDDLLRRFCGRSVNALDPQSVSRLLGEIAAGGAEVLPKTQDPASLRILFDAYPQLARRLLAMMDEGVRTVLAGPPTQVK